MPWTLYRYILREVLKLLLISAAVLVLLVSFAAAIKPLADGLLGPVALLKFVGFSIPTMIGFTLPFAGAFASTLVFHRLTSDNEIIACNAGGLSYLQVLLPIFCLGLVLTIGLILLSNYVVPSFYLGAARTLQRDLTRVVVSQVQQKRPIDFGEMVLYADAAAADVPIPPTPEGSVPVDDAFELRGVAVGRLDDRGRVSSDATADTAQVHLYAYQGRTWVALRLNNVTYYDKQRGELFFVESWEVPPVPVPTPLKDKIRFRSWSQLKKLEQQPEDFALVAEARDALVDQLAVERVLDSMRAGLSGQDAGEAVVLVGPRRDVSYTFSAPRATRVDSALLLEQEGLAGVTVLQMRQGVPVRRFESPRVAIEVTPGDPDPEPRVDVEMSEVRVFDLRRAGVGTEQDELSLPRLQWPEPVYAQTTQQSIPALQQTALDAMTRAPVVRDEQGAQRPGPVALALERLDYRMIQLQREIVAELHERVASSVLCTLLLLLGCVLALRFRDSLPLVVFFWSFLLAALAVVLVHTGKNMVTIVDYPQIAGLAVVWSGNGLLLFAGVLNYRMMAKH